MLEIIESENPDFFAIFKELQSRIPDNLIYDTPELDFGREYFPHITLLYGINISTQIDQLKSIFTKLNRGYYEYRIIGTSKFSNPEFDVLKIGVESDDCNVANSFLKKLSYQNNYPIYTPHITVAYMKPGTADSFCRSFSPNNQLILKSNKIVYTNGTEKYSLNLSFKQ